MTLSAALLAVLLLFAPAGASTADSGAADTGAGGQSLITPSASASSRAVPGMQPAVPGASQTPPAPPQAPGDPLTWIFILFGVLGVALLIARAVLVRRAADDDSMDPAQDSAGGDEPA